MAGNPNWWGSLNSQFSSSDSSFCSSSPTVSSDYHHHHHPQDFPVIRSWSQLLLGEEKIGGNLEKKEDESNWEEQVLNLMNPSVIRVPDVKPQLGIAPDQSTTPSKFYDDFHPNNTPHHFVSSPNSCTTAVSSAFNFSGGLPKVAPSPPTPAVAKKRQLNGQDQSSECNSRGSTGGVQTKKARVQQSSAQPALKVRKEKLGDRITALHQLVSPFGKTDTASVLSEAIGYIRFLQGQIEALSSPYMRNNTSTVHHQQSIQERHCLFPQEDIQFLNDHGREPLTNQDLRSRGLCLVPISCTQYVANDSGADFWAPAAFGGRGGDF